MYIAYIYYCIYIYCVYLYGIKITLIWISSLRNFPAGNYMFQINNRNTSRRCEICSKLTIKTSEPCSSVSIVNFEQANTGWVCA